MNIEPLSAFFFIIAIGIGIAVFRSDHHAKEIRIFERVDQAQNRLAEEPHNSKPAWDLARLTLESYFQRNLSQSSAIFWLSLLVMLVGFGIVIWGIARSMARPLGAAHPTGVAPELLATLAGIITQFIGVSFLVIYRSVVQQAAGYAKTLERLNSIGMAMQILDTIPEEVQPDDLKCQTKAHVIDMLVRLSYGVPLAPDANSSLTAQASTYGVTPVDAAYANGTSPGITYGNGASNVVAGDLGAGSTDGAISASPYNGSTFGSPSANQTTNPSLAAPILNTPGVGTPSGGTDGAASGVGLNATTVGPISEGPDTPDDTQTPPSNAVSGAPNLSGA